MNNFDRQYIEVMKRIIDTGVDRPDRTGIGSRAIWGAMIDVDLADGFPIPTTRFSAFEKSQKETWWMLRGETDTKILEKKGVKFWKGNTTREFLDNRGLNYLPVGHMGKGYGFQWRNFGGRYLDRMAFDDSLGYYCDDGGPFKSEIDYYTNDRSGVDQVVNLLEGLKNDPNGRRHIITAWNPMQTDEMALPPCHLYQQYQILDGRLNSSFVMRSNDWIYGAPFNFMGYALLNIAFSKYLGLKPGHLTYFGTDVHIYANQLDIAKQQVLRRPYELPTLELVKDVKTFDALLNLKAKDFVFTSEYKAHPDFIDKPPMAV